MWSNRIQQSLHSCDVTGAWIGDHWDVRDEESRRKEVYMISHTDGHKINIKYIVDLVPAMQLNRENDL